MVKERTLSIIKPDAVQKNHIGAIISEFEKNGLKIAACRLMQLSDQQAKDFYAVHKERPFYKDLVEFMTSGPVVVMVLEGDNAIAKNREIMGDTNPESARKNAPNSIRARFAETIDANAVHGSDGPETAKNEILFFFPNGEVVARH